MIDIAQPIDLAKVKELQVLGHSVIGCYARTDRTPFSTVEAIHEGGSKVLTIWEAGNPTSPDYFTEDQAKADLERLLTWCQLVGQPASTTVSPAYDYDAAFADVEAYGTIMHEGLLASGYFQLPYLCYPGLNGFAAAGIMPVDINTGKGGWLPGSTGFGGPDGYARGRKMAAVIQTNEDATVAGLNCDEDIVVQMTIQTAERLISVAW